MKRIAAVAFVAILASLSTAKADQPGPDWMPAQQVVEKVLKSGYTQVTQLEADDGRWEGEGIKNGQKMDFHADPKTGVITFEKLDHSQQRAAPSWRPLSFVDVIPCRLLANADAPVAAADPPPKPSEHLTNSAVEEVCGGRC